jgi:hypothetical protein
MNCIFYKKKKNSVCELGYHGGLPTKETCIHCINNGLNTEEKAKELFDIIKISHPSSAPRVSGCCDSARNYIDR